MPMTPQQLMLLAQLQGNQMGPAGTAVGPPSASLGPPMPTPNVMPADGGPPTPPLAGTFDNPATAPPTSAMMPQVPGDMNNPGYDPNISRPFANQEYTGSTGIGEGDDRQRAGAVGSLPPFQRTPLGALLIPKLIGQSSQPLRGLNNDGLSWDSAYRGFLPLSH